MDSLLKAGKPHDTKPYDRPNPNIFGKLASNVKELLSLASLLKAQEKKQDKHEMKQENPYCSSDLEVIQVVRNSKLIDLPAKTHLLKLVGSPVERILIPHSSKNLFSDAMMSTFSENVVNSNERVNHNSNTALSYDPLYPLLYACIQCGTPCETCLQSTSTKKNIETLNLTNSNPTQVRKSLRNRTCESENFIVPSSADAERMLRSFRRISSPVMSPRDPSRTYLALSKKLPSNFSKAPLIANIAAIIKSTHEDFSQSSETSVIKQKTLLEESGVYENDDRNFKQGGGKWKSNINLQHFSYKINDDFELIKGSSSPEILPITNIPNISNSTAAENDRLVLHDMELPFTFSNPIVEQGLENISWPISSSSPDFKFAFSSSICIPVNVDEISESEVVTTENNSESSEKDDTNKLSSDKENVFFNTLDEKAAADENNEDIPRLTEDNPKLSENQFPIQERAKQKRKISESEINDAEQTSKRAFSCSSFTAPSSTWECDTCWDHNPLHKSKCLACETDRPSKNNTQRFHFENMTENNAGTVFSKTHFWPFKQGAIDVTTQNTTAPTVSAAPILCTSSASSAIIPESSWPAFEISNTNLQFSTPTTVSVTSSTASATPILTSPNASVTPVSATLPNASATPVSVTSQNASATPISATALSGFSASTSTFNAFAFGTQNAESQSPVPATPTLETSAKRPRGDVTSQLFQQTAPAFNPSFQFGNSVSELNSPQDTPGGFTFVPNPAQTSSNGFPFVNFNMNTPTTFNFGAAPADGFRFTATNEKQGNRGSTAPRRILKGVRRLNRREG